MNGDIKTYKIKNDIYDVPVEESDEFLKSFPDAIEIKSFVEGKDTFDIPVDKMEDFMKEFPEAKIVGEPDKKKEPTRQFDVSTPDYTAPASSTRIDSKTTLLKDLSDVSPMSMDEFKEIVRNPAKTKEENLIHQVKMDTQNWYRERGGLTPLDKIDSFNLDLEGLRRNALEEGMTQDVFDNQVVGLASKWGLHFDGKSISVLDSEKNQYKEVAEKNLKQRLSELAEKEKDPYMKNIWNVLNTESSNVLNSVFNVMSLSEKIGNAMLSPLGMEESSYWQDVRNYEADVVEKLRAENERYDKSITAALEVGNIGEAIGHTVMEVAGALPLLTTLIIPHAMGQIAIGLIFMGFQKGSEEYLTLDRNPDISFFTKATSSLNKALNEVVFENLGTVSILNNVKRGIAISGKEAIAKAITDSYRGQFEKSMTMLMRGISPMVQEGASEMATEVSDIIVDMAMGIKTPDAFERVGDAGIVGGVIGLSIGSPGIRENKSKYVKSIVNAIPKDFDPEAKLEAATLLLEVDNLEYLSENAPKSLKRVYDKKISTAMQRMEELAAEQGMEMGTSISAEAAELGIKEQKPTEEKYITESETEVKAGMPQVMGFVEKTKEGLLLGDSIARMKNKFGTEDISDLDKINKLREEANKAIEEIDNAIETKGKFEIEGNVIEDSSELDEFKQIYERRLYRLDKAEEYLKGKVPKEKITVYRGSPEKRIKENLGFTWYATEESTAKNYAWTGEFGGKGEGTVSKIEVEKPKNPLELPYKSNTDVRASNIGGNLRTLIDNKLQEGNITEKKAIELSDKVEEFEKLAGEKLEKWHTKINKNPQSKIFAEILNELGYDSILIYEGKNKTEPTYGIIKLKEEPKSAEEIRSDKGLLPEEGIKPEEREDEGSENIQLPTKEGGEAGEPALPQKEKVSLLAAKLSEIKTTMSADMGKISKLKESSKKKAEAINARRETLEKFISENREELKKIKGVSVPAMLTKIKDIKTDTSLKNALDYMEKVITRNQTANQTAEDADLAWKAFDELEKYSDVEGAKYNVKGAKVKKFKNVRDTKLFDRINRIRDLVYNRTQEDLMAMPPVKIGKEELSYKQVTDKLNEVGEEGLTAEEFELWEEMQFAGVYKESITTDEVMRLAEELKRIYSEEKSEAKKRYEAAKLVEKDKIERNKSIITKGEPVKTKHGEPEPQISFWEKLRQSVTVPTLSSWHSLLDMLGVGEGNTMPFETTLNKDYGEPIHEANKEYFLGRKKITTQITKKFRELFGKDWKTIEVDFKEKQEVKYKNEFGREETGKWSQETAGYVYAQMQVEGMEPTMANNDMGYMRKTKEGDYILTKRGEALIKFLNPKMKEWVDWGTKFYNEVLYNRLNEAYRELHHRDMPKTKMYIPIFRDVANTIDSAEDMFSDRNITSLANNRYMMSRTRSNAPFREVGFTDVLLNYVKTVEHIKAFGKPLRKINRELMNPEVKKAISQTWKTATSINDVIKDFVDELSGKKMVGKYSKTFEFLRRRATMAMLGLKPSIMIKQVTSLPAYLEFINLPQLIYGMGDFMVNYKTARKTLKESAYIQERWEAGKLDREVEDLVKGYNALGATKNKFAEFSMYLLKKGDLAPIMLGGWSVYKARYKEAFNDAKKRMSESEAKKYAHDFAIKKFELATKYLQQSSYTDDLSYWQRHSSLSKLFTMYATAPYSYMRLVNAGARRIIQQGDLRRGAKAVILGHVILPVFFRAVSMGFDFDEEDKWWWDLVEAGVFGPFDSMFMIGDALTHLTDRIRERPFDYQVTPAQSIVKEAGDALMVAKRILFEELDNGLDLQEAWELADNLFYPTSLATGLPYHGARAVITGWSDVIQGDVEGAPDIVRSILGFKTKKAKGVRR